MLPNARSARRFHNSKAVGSSPTPATKLNQRLTASRALAIFSFVTLLSREIGITAHVMRKMKWLIQSAGCFCWSMWSPSAECGGQGANYHLAVVLYQLSKWGE